MVKVKKSGKQKSSRRGPGVAVEDAPHPAAAMFAQFQRMAGGAAAQGVLAVLVRFEERFERATVALEELSAILWAQSDEPIRKEAEAHLLATRAARAGVNLNGEPPVSEAREEPS